MEPGGPSRSTRIDPGVYPHGYCHRKYVNQCHSDFTTTALKTQIAIHLTASATAASESPAETQPPRSAPAPSSSATDASAMAASPAILPDEGSNIASVGT